MKVSVVIPAYNEGKYLESCLKSLVDQIDPPDEIIVVDNNSTDNTVAVAKKFPTRIITCKEQGITPARNKGFDAAKYEIIARTDADTIVPRDWILRIKKSFEENPSVAALSGPAIYYDMPYLKQKSYLQVNLLHFKLFKRVFGNENLFGPNLSIRKSVWEEVKDSLCKSDKLVHEDNDLAIHVGYSRKILFLRNLIVASSARRWKKISPNLEYPYRYLRTIQHHKRSLHGLRTGTKAVGKFIPKPRRIIKNIRSLNSEKW